MHQGFFHGTEGKHCFSYDLDGGTADETVRFGLDGISYEIDLSAPHVLQLRDALQPFISVARKNAGRGPRAGRQAVAARNNDVAQIRQWARDNGHKVSERGRIQADIVEAYRKANG